MKKVCIIGGCGHVGIPLGIALGYKGNDVKLVDINLMAIEAINKGILPFQEDNADEYLKSILGKNLIATNNIDEVKTSDVVIFVTGTPVDEHHNPRVQDVINVIENYIPYMNKNQLVILRSTIFPGVFDVVENALKEKLGGCKLAFCPERIVQGKGIEEIFNLPQIISANSDAAFGESSELFGNITKTIIKLTPTEAELAKLMTNSWRYLEFAIANQFYMMVESKGQDFYKILDAMKYEYPRAQHFTKAGLAAGPCLFKDTMQLSAFYNNQFFLGQAGMLVNEGLPNFLIEKLEEKMGTLKDKNIVILGMTFKPNNDDTRESLSFKIKKLLSFKMANVICSDPYLKDTEEMSKAISKADGIILGVPHKEYLNLNIKVPFVDCWGVWRDENSKNLGIKVLQCGGKK